MFGEDDKIADSRMQCRKVGLLSMPAGARGSSQGQGPSRSTETRVSEGVDDPRPNHE